MAETINLSIRRGLPGEEGMIERFTVPYSDGMSILDALLWIQANEDSTLAVRYSCINANACKECSVQIDGKIEYACTARLSREGALVEPLADKPLIRDLVTEIAPAKEMLSKALA